jgi:hypothetical protein
VGAIDQVVLRFRPRNVPEALLELNEASATILKQLAIHGKAAALAQAPAVH